MKYIVAQIIEALPFWSTLWRVNIGAMEMVKENWPEEVAFNLRLRGWIGAEAKGMTRRQYVWNQHTPCCSLKLTLWLQCGKWTGAGQEWTQRTWTAWPVVRLKDAGGLGWDARSREGDEWQSQQIKGSRINGTGWLTLEWNQARQNARESQGWPLHFWIGQMER